MQASTNPVDEKQVRVPHFGSILSIHDWKELETKSERLSTKFIIDPYIRFKNSPGEQATMFFEDNNGYAVEIKAFKDISFLFKPMH
jgi:extradiol dioxygenase family protein